MKVKQVSEEVFFGDETMVTVNNQDIIFLKEKALSNKRERSRLCAHRDTDELLHDMLIIHTGDTYVTPHKHLNRSESFHIIEGSVNAILFDDDGSITNVVQMGDYSSGNIFFYRIPEKFYHTLVITSEIIVFHEATTGPFNSEDTIFAPWAPNSKDTVAVKKFMGYLEHGMKSFIY